MQVNDLQPMFDKRRLSEAHSAEAEPSQSLTNLQVR